jgi:hypothetical protein
MMSPIKHQFIAVYAAGFGQTAMLDCSREGRAMSS